mgnify:FL=1
MASTAHPDSPQSAFRMTPLERRSSLALASIFALRMLGLFVILPVFAVYAHQLPGGENEFLVGVTLGIYGLTQGILQIPFGAASDRFGRKPVIAVGLVIFAAGSFLAAFADNIWLTLIGRAIQGAGAISAAVTAFISDSVRETVLTKAMAMVGASIGLTFALSLVISPPLAKAFGVDGLFFLTGVLAVLAILVVKFVVPDASASPETERDTRPTSVRWQRVFFDPQLVRLNIAIFALHAVLTGIFIVVPTRLIEMKLPAVEHWHIYLPAVLVGFLFMGPPIMIGEKKAKTVPILRIVTLLLCLVLVLFAFLMHSVWEIAFLLALFFMCFNVLEATLPGLISRSAPKEAKGLALGIYNTTQNLGLFVGGAAGGWISQHFNAETVFIAAAFVMLCSFASATGLREPVRTIRQPGDALEV